MAMLKRRMEVEGRSRQEVSNKYYLLHEAIYSFHRVLHEIWDGIAGFKPSDGVKRTIISASLFSRRTRMFHWLAISNWRVDPNTVLDEIRKIRLESPNVWEEYYLHLASDYSLRHIKQGLMSIKKLVEANTSVLSEDKVDVNHRLFSLYEGYHHNPHLYLDGIIYRNLKKLHLGEHSHQRKIDYVTGHYVKSDKPCYKYKGEQRQQDCCYIKYPWVEVSFYENGEQISDIDPFQCQEEQKGSTSVASENEIPPFTEEQEGRLAKVRPGWDIMKLLNQRFFLDGLVEFTASHFAVVPIYDVWIGREAWGSLCGNLLLFFTTSEEFERFTHQATSPIEDRPLTKLIDECRRLSNVFNGSATSMVLNEPIDPPYDLIDHFVKHLNILQDWRSVIVYQGSKPQYCYRWHDVVVGQFRRERFDCANPPAQKSPCEECRAVNPANADSRPHFRWEDDYLDDDYLPELSEEEKPTFQGIRLEFEYPLTACIPRDNMKRKFLEEEYTRQQLEVLRGLLPKVRARRAALRNAAVSIMGRNMSHNIGSHVLARLGVSGLGNREEVARLLAFLQERMDFIAEVSTTRAFINLPTYFYGEAINYFGGAEALPGGEKDENNQGQKLLLEHISGVENRVAKVFPKNVSDEEFRFGCPGGTVGSHALYVILENIIRNTAKHAGSGCGEVGIFIRVRPCTKEAYREFYQVTVWDQEENEVSRRKLEGEQLNWISGASEGNGFRELKLSHGRTVTINSQNEVTTADFIQLVIEKEPLIDEDGVVRPNYWGVREIYLAAAYLRSISLEELEARLTGPPILEALLVNNDGYALTDQEAAVTNNFKNLGYRFYLERAHVAAVIREQDPGCDTEALKRHGIEVHKVDGATDQKKEEFRSLPKKGFKHTYLVVPNQQYEAWLNDPSVSRSRLPVAVLVEGDLMLDLKNPQSVEQTLAERYLNKMKGSSGNNAIMTFATGDAPTQGTCMDHVEFGEVSRALKGSSQIEIDGSSKILPCKALIFDKHHKVAEGVQLLNNDPDYDQLAKLGFYECYRSESAQRPIIEECKPPRKEINKSLLTIAALTRVLILDERLQGALEESYRWYRKAKVGKFLWLTGVFVPRGDECDLNRPSASKIDSWIKGRFKNQAAEPATEAQKIDFLVIHQGILDRLNDGNGQKYQDPAAWLGALAKNLGCEDRIVVCSGRGAPSTVPPIARFVPLSTILAWTIHRPSKFHLVNALWHARHPELIAERRQER